MKKMYNQHFAAAGLRRLGLAAVLAAGVGTAQAQTLPYTVSASSSSAGTYTDLGTSGTAVTTNFGGAAINTDDDNSAALSIPFNFVFNGTTYTSFVLNTNGLIKLGGTAPAADSYIQYGKENTGGPVNGAETNVIMPFNIDLAGAAGGAEYRYNTTGTAPNRVCTIQWKNVTDKPKATSAMVTAPIATQYASISFQAKLYESTNTVQFAYGPTTPGAVAGDNFKFVNVGVKGSGTGAGQLLLVQKASVSGWSAAVFVNATYQVATIGTTNTHNVRGSIAPDAGRTYTIAVPVTNDAAMGLIYGYGKVVSPAGSPVVIKAIVRNAGTAAIGSVNVTMTVTGANSFTDTQVASNLGTTATTNTAIVTFAPLPLPNVGNNVITVSVAADGNNSNNSNSQPLVTSSTDFSCIIAGASGSGGVGAPPGSERGFGAKFTLSAPRDVVAVRAYLYDATPSTTAKTTVGETVYGAIVDVVTGAIVARSPNYVVRAADINAIHTFTLASAYTLPAGDFIAGLVQIAPAAPSLQFFPMGLQSETPTRPDAFYRFDAISSAPVDVAGSNFGRYMLEAVTAAPATCPTVTNIAVSNVTNTSASVAFTGPTNATGYQLVYVLAGTTPTASSPTTPTFTASPYTLGGLTPNTGYDVYVRALCGANDRSQLAGPVFFSTPCTPPIVNAFPYSENFDVVTRGQDLPCGITVLDSNNDSNTWGIASTAQVTQGGQIVTVNLVRSAPNAMVYFASSNNFGDDWFFLPAIRFQAGSRYRLAFWYKGQRSLFVEKLEVKYGNTTNPADQTNLLYSNTAISSPTYAQASNASTPVVADIVPTTTGPKYIGFHAFSDPDQLFLAVDDVTITAVLATSDAMNRAVSIFPNPSNTGSFNLEIHGANAKEALQVEVTNMLGQRVYAGVAKDNFSNQLDLSNLANGIYSLKVRNGAEYMQQQLSIVK